MTNIPDPMLADDRKWPVFSHPDWLFEVKYDGWRVGAAFGFGAAMLRTRGGADCTTWFPEIASALSTFEGGPFVVDGEMCILDNEGRSDFNRLQDRALQKHRYQGSEPVVYCVFDLLRAGDTSLIDLPVALRKDLLADLLAEAPPGLNFVHAIPGHGQALYTQVVKLELEGLVAKRADSPYEAGVRSELWKKLKRPGAVPPERFRRG